MDYLKKFHNRMEKVGAYALLFQNILPKTTWKQYGFTEFYEQTNLVFSVLIFIMEQSLKESICTMDEIASFIDKLNSEKLKKSLTYKQCKELGDFIVDVILCNEGRAMYFKGMDYENNEYKDLHISFVANKVVYLDGDIKRTTYYLTDDGYNLLLSTLEFESNMMLTIHEMIFKLHLEKASYEQAVDDIKNIFNRFRIQLHKINETMKKIKQNALLYSVVEYKKILKENLDIIQDTKGKFLGYKEHVSLRVKELEEKDINIQKLKKEELKNLQSLKIIEDYLNRALNEHQKILSSHFDLKILYDKELEDLSMMSLIKRFHLRDEVYNKVIEDASKLENIEVFLNPLFNRDVDKIYNLNKSFELQKPITKKDINDEEQILEIDDEEWLEELQNKWLQKKDQYIKSLQLIIYAANSSKSKDITLKEIQSELETEKKEILIPTVEIFKELMVELIKNEEIDIEALKREEKEFISDNTMKFQLNIFCLEIIRADSKLSRIKKINIKRLKENSLIVFENVSSQLGKINKISCSDVLFSIE
jgi:hypothetical protein